MKTVEKTKTVEEVVGIRCGGGARRCRPEMGGCERVEEEDEVDEMMTAVMLGGRSEGVAGEGDEWRRCSVADIIGRGGGRRSSPANCRGGPGVGEDEDEEIKFVGILRSFPPFSLTSP